VQDYWQNMNSAQEPRMESEHSQFQLLRERRFAPFFWTQFLGAGNTTSTRMRW